VGVDVAACGGGEVAAAQPLDTMEIRMSGRNFESRNASPALMAQPSLKG
jgi:hypothetical protein